VALIIIFTVVVVAAAVGAWWWFYKRQKQTMDNYVQQIAQPPQGYPQGYPTQQGQQVYAAPPPAQVPPV